MVKVNVKPLSVNKAWQGRRFKTKEYKEYEKELLLKLSPLELPKKPYSLKIIFGVENKLTDIDNLLKLFIDIAQKKYGFNDRDIYELNVKKEIVKKGFSFIKFKISNL